MPEKTQNDIRKLDKFVRESFSRFEERQNRTEERQNRTEEWQQRTEEWQQRTDEWQKRTDEWQKRTDERLDRSEKWQESTDEWQKRTDERLDKIDNLINLFKKFLESAEQERKANQAFRQQMLEIADRIVLKFDVFESEKKALGAAIDRHQVEIDGLKESDAKQNITIETLNSRLDRLEAGRPSV
jgi:chromosome segregation ATPase